MYVWDWATNIFAYNPMQEPYVSYSLDPHLGDSSCFQCLILTVKKDYMSRMLDNWIDVHHMFWNTIQYSSY
jgi:hypothetical protein